MKASESNPNYPSKVREMTNYTIREIKKVCKDIGPRPSGEENERKAQDYVADSMSKVADSVVKEKFELHPKAFMGWVPLDVILMTISIVLTLLSYFDVLPSASTAFSVVSVVLTSLAIIFTFLSFCFIKSFSIRFSEKRDLQCSLHKKSGRRDKAPHCIQRTYRLRLRMVFYSSRRRQAAHYYDSPRIRRNSHYSRGINSIVL